MKTIRDVVQSVRQKKTKKIALAGISDEEIRIVTAATEEQLATFILIDKEDQLKAAQDIFSGHGSVSFECVEDTHDAAKKAVKLVREGKAALPMKGQIHTSTFIKAVLDKENGLSNGKRLSQITVFDGYNDELQFLTDCAINIKPSMNELVDIIENAVAIYRVFGEPIPKVALLAAVENVNEKMPDTLVAAAITQMNRRGQIKGCIIDGPLSLDNAISEAFAAIKNIDSPVAGKAQILVSSMIQEANSLSKGIIHYAKRSAASIIAGTSVPVIMTSRTDTAENKLNTIAMSSFLEGAIYE